MEGTSLGEKYTRRSSQPQPVASMASFCIRAIIKRKDWTPRKQLSDSLYSQRRCASVISKDDGSNYVSLMSTVLSTHHKPRDVVFKELIPHSSTSQPTICSSPCEKLLDDGMVMLNELIGSELRILHLKFKMLECRNIINTDLTYLLKPPKISY
ncbi:hypothetical protein QQ045_012879 [Rhodiola kirilowii]